MKKTMWFLFALLYSAFVSSAADEQTSGVLLNSARLDSSSVAAARLSELSPKAIERGLKDAQLLSRPEFDEQNRVFTLTWHSITKTINGTEHSKALKEPLITELKLDNEVREIPVGQTVTLKGNLDSMLEDFDELLNKAEQETTEINTEKNVDASVNNANEEFTGSSSGSGGGGYLSEGGTTTNPDIDNPEINVDEITSTREQCPLNVDWSSLNVFKQERVIKTSDSGEITDNGSCYNIGSANPIEKDYAASCNIQINGLTDYAKGYQYYAIVDGKRMELSGCKYDGDDAQPMTIENDFGACSLSLASVNTVEDVYFPAAVKYTMLNGTRYNLTECEVIPTERIVLPTREESCNVSHNIPEMTSFTMKRVLTLDPTEKNILKTGICKNDVSYPISKDYGAGCDIQITNDSFIRGFKYFTTIDKDRINITGCEYLESEVTEASISLDYESCGFSDAKVLIDSGIYEPAFVRFTMIDGTRYDLSQCVTSKEITKPLPTKTEVCQFNHNVDSMQSIRKERVDTYNPANTEVIKTGDCYSTEEISMFRDYEAGCSIRFVGEKYQRGYKVYSSIDGKRYDHTPCSYDDTELTETTILKDFDSCSISNATILDHEGIYRPAFIRHTVVDGQRYDLGGCETAASESRPLPTRTAVCELEHSIPNMLTYRKERIDTYDPENKEVVNQGDCYSIEEISIQRDFDAGCAIQFNNDDTYLRGFKYFSTVDGKRYELSACEYNESDLANANVFKDFSQCGYGDAVINAAQGFYNPAFVRYTLVDGQRYDLSNCQTSTEDKEQLPIKTETCPIEHSIANNKSYTKERVDTYNPENTEVLITGDCVVKEEIAFQKNFDAGCSIQLNNSENSYTRGFKLFSMVEGKRYDHSACQYDNSDAVSVDITRDYEKCGFDDAAVNVTQGYYNPAFVKHTLIDGKRYDMSTCMTDANTKTDLPKKVESCPIEHSIGDLKTYIKERVDTYDPANKEVLVTGDCITKQEIAIQRDYDAGCQIRFNSDDTYLRGYKLFSMVDGKRYEHTSCEYDIVDKTASTIIKDFGACSLSNAVVDAVKGEYQPAFVRYTLIDGKRYELGGCETALDEVLPLPTKTEVCELNHSLPEMKTYRMERVDIYDPANRERLVVGDCYSIEEIVIQKDFDAGCAIQVNNTFNTYLRGYKLFSTVDNKKHVLSECEYDSSSAISFEKFRDYSRCDLDLAVVDLSKNEYQPAFIEYTLIDNSRYELSGCINDEADIRLLPIKKETCEMEFDYSNLKAYEMEREDIQDPKAKNTLKIGDCYSTKEFDLIRDYDYLSCLDLPNYTTQDIALGYRHFYKKNSKDQYIGECGFDTRNKKTLLQEIGSCTATENLTTLKANINKKWYYVGDNGNKNHITDCQNSDEIYNIINTENTCTPQYIASSGKVIIQTRKGWLDGSNTWHYVTSCSPSSGEASVSKEWCTSPQYEHNFVGGQSYKRSRQYYLHNGSKVYINSCSRDSTGSYPHIQTASGCSFTFNDTDKVSQPFSKTTVSIDGQTMTIKNCTAQGNPIPYIPLGRVTQLDETKSTECGLPPYPNLGGMYQTYHTKSFGTPIYNPSSTYYKIYGGCSMTGWYKVISNLTVEADKYQRSDGSIIYLNQKAEVTLK